MGGLCRPVPPEGGMYKGFSKPKSIFVLCVLFRNQCIVRLEAASSRQHQHPLTISFAFETNECEPRSIAQWVHLLHPIKATLAAVLP